MARRRKNLKRKRERRRERIAKIKQEWRMRTRLKLRSVKTMKNKKKWSGCNLNSNTIIIRSLIFNNNKNKLVKWLKPIIYQEIKFSKRIPKPSINYSIIQAIIRSLIILHQIRILKNWTQTVCWQIGGSKWCRMNWRTKPFID